MVISPTQWVFACQALSCRSRRLGAIEFASVGRANSSGKPILYLADRIETALSEIRLQQGHVITANFQIQANKVCQILPIGEMLSIQRTGKSRFVPDAGPINDIINACEHEDAQSYLITDSFLHEILVNDKAPYQISSYLCDALYKKYPSVTVIAYPSAQLNAAINYAVKTDDFWNVWGVSGISKFNGEHLVQGVYKVTQRKNVIKIYDNDQLAWGNFLEDQRITDLPKHLWTPL